jgi:hypothetical protein
VQLRISIADPFKRLPIFRIARFEIQIKIEQFKEWDRCGPLFVHKEPVTNDRKQIKPERIHEIKCFTRQRDSGGCQCVEREPEVIAPALQTLSIEHRSFFGLVREPLFFSGVRQMRRNEDKPSVAPALGARLAVARF